MPAPTLSLDVKRVRDVHVVALTGAVDASSVESLRQTIEPLLALPQSKVLLDGQNLSYVSSTGFGLLFAWSRSSQERQGLFALSGIAKKILNLMKLLGIEKYVTIYVSSDAALEAMSRPPGS
jgi:anti-sigma B factor antagonist